MSVKEYENLEIPGVGEIRARPGTSTLELAGAAKFWHDQYKSAVESIWESRRQGFLGGAGFVAVMFACGELAYYLWR